MKICKYGHACLLVEVGEARILVDPGAFSSGFEGETGLNAILITHQHQDHMVAEKVAALLANNPQAAVYADEASAKLLSEAGVAAQAVHAGDRFEAGGTQVAVFGRDHAVIHADVPGIPDVGYMIGKRFFYPGDAFTVPSEPVEVLAAPVSAPWLTIGQAVDYVRAVRPKVAIPVHDAVLSAVGKQIQMSALERLTKAQGVHVEVVEDGASVAFAD
jgi:L-ascorbate metabolism protein UlaG (beta-lactamase superfamily)